MQVDAVFGPVGRAALAALVYELDARLGLVGVHELLEPAAALGIVDDFLPFAFVRVDEKLHLPLEFFGDPQPVVDNHVAEVFDAPFQAVEPDAGSHQPVGRADVVHQKAIDVANRGLFVEVGGQEVGMPGLGPAVAAHIQIVPLFGGDQAEVFALGLGTFADAARNCGLEFVGGPQSLVAVLHANGETNRVLHAIAAPGRPHATLDRPQRFAVGMAAFKTGIDQKFPDVGQVLHLRAEQVDALGARNFGIQIIFLGDRPQGDQLFGRDFAPRNTGNHRVQAPPLHVRQKAVVGVLQRGVVENVVVPEARHDRRHGRLADFTSLPAAMLLDQFGERFVAFDFDNLEKFLARTREVLAQVAVDSYSGSFQLPIQQRRDQRHTAPATRARLGAGLEFAHGREALFGNGSTNLPLRDVVARANLAVVVETIGAGGSSGLLADDQFAGGNGKRFAAFGQRREPGVIARVADEHPPQKPGSFGIEQQLLVNPAEGVVVQQRPGPLGRRFVITEAGDVDPHQFELGRQVGPGEALHSAA